MFQIQTRPSSTLWFGNRAGQEAVFAPLNGLVSWWQIGDYFGFIGGTFVQGVTGFDQGPAAATLTIAATPFSAATDRGDNNGAGIFSSGSFMGRSDAVGTFNAPDSFTVTVWLKLTSETSGAVVSYSNGGTNYWRLSYNAVGLNFVWTVLGQTGTIIVASTDGVTSDIWYLVECYYDGPSGMAGIRVMDTRPADYFVPTAAVTVEGAVPGRRQRSAANFRIGAQSTLASVNALICGVGFWTRRLNKVEIGTINKPLDYNWVLFHPSGGPETAAQEAAGPAPTDCFAVGTPRIVYFTDQTGGAYQHEIWRDDGGGWFLLTTLLPGVTEYQDDTAVTEESELATEGGESFRTEGGAGDEFGAEVPSRYKVRATGGGDPSGFCTEFDPAASPDFLVTEGNQPLKTEGNEPTILE